MVLCIIFGSVLNCYGIYFPKCEKSGSNGSDVSNWILMLKNGPACAEDIFRKTTAQKEDLVFAVPSVDIIF